MKQADCSSGREKEAGKRAGERESRRVSNALKSSARLTTGLWVVCGQGAGGRQGEGRRGLHMYV